MKTRLILVLVLIVVLLCAAKDVKTGAISGTVRETGEMKLSISQIEVSCLQNNIQIGKAITDDKGAFKIGNLPPGKYTVEVNDPLYEPWKKENVKVSSGTTTKLDIRLKPAPMITDELGTNDVDMAAYEQALSQIGNIYSTSAGSAVHAKQDMAGSKPVYFMPYSQPNVSIPPNSTEDYTAITPNMFHSPLDEPLSTFSIDVDTANYSNIRRMLMNNMLPEPKSVRIEELVNYFEYDYPQPEGKHPFEVYTEMGVCPWNQKRNLVHIGIQGKKLNLDAAPPSNLVFLIDVSGSMNTPQKLPLVKESLSLLIDNLRSRDRVAIVVYAGAAGLVLPSTTGDNKSNIRLAMDQLQAGGSTAGGAGIELAYKTARENFVTGGNNRIILCTDGDFNVGASSDAHLTGLVEENRNNGVYLTVLGFGMGNYKDNKMELLADKGNGNYAYIDTIHEAKKVLVNEMVSTLYTIARDVKLQVEFNPAHVKAYRLIGYENRLLNKEDFKDDTKDAGELGAGHNVTAVYE
nr:von Willebrand factor type A domain-containing protein [Candidatus Cloacimonadota bacterium]